MKVAAFTSFTGAYIPNARILAKSVAAVHPEWDMYALFNDRTPDEIRWEDEPFTGVVFADWLKVKGGWERWAFDYSVVEFCTATKGVMTEFLFDVYGYDLVVYLDPDVLVTSRLNSVVEILQSGEASAALTPHITDAEESIEAIESHEIAALKHGTFNLGFFAFYNRPQGRTFLRWWADRLLSYSHIDFQSGLFTDQKWCNIAPYIFDGIYIIKDRTFNVATWNMTNRKVHQDVNGTWTVNGEPMVFYHFSGFGHDFAWADRELRLFAEEGTDILKLWSVYKRLYEDNKLSHSAPPWFWGQTITGEGISVEMRRAARHGTSLNPFSKL
ncbi:hypothetical protein [Nitrospirillum pindoramense]|uniref:Glycosyl transferase family 8 n=1 Tax=Nitrospirillum amazonense TaxID=28077 RepID=A0A560H5U4_9PROT|nr:hypothetical protein [Nitrospirillum amazonense]TWB41179.1 hypothetical protein FBZ90_108203 [Nitrospirillum amazonense]